MKKYYITKNEQRRIKIIRFMIVCITLLMNNLTSAQNLDFTWAKKLGGSANDLGNDIVADSAGNVYTTGSFVGSADFDPGPATNNLTANGGWDIFVSKLDEAGNLLWAKGFGGAGIDDGYSISVDGSGNVYTTGRFTGTVDFNPGSGTSNLTSSGGHDIFISKLDAAGNFVWAKSFGSTGSDEGKALWADDAGNVCITGFFSGTVDFNPRSGGSILTSSGSSDVFILKLNTSGNTVWAKKFGGTSNDRGWDIIQDAIGNIYTTGAFRGTVDFDPGLGVANLSTVNGAQDIFVSKFDNLGNFQWAKGCGGTGDDIGFAIDLDANGNIYFAGEFSQTADFNPGTAVNNLTAYGSADGFITKLNAGGNFMWTKQLGGTSFDKVNGISIDKAGNIYLIGEFSGTMDANPGRGTNTLTSLGNKDIFMVKLNTIGNHLWSTSYGRNLVDIGTSVYINEAGDLYATGNFMVSIDFDPGIPAYWVSTNGGSDAFVLKYGCSPTTGVHEAVACSEYRFNGVIYTSNNNTATDTLVNSVGCDSIVTLNLTINNVNVSVTRTGNKLTANLSGAKYQWINCEKGPIVGENNASYTATKDGAYAVEITYKGCTDTSDCDTIGISGISNSGLNNNPYQLFPNPINSLVSISNFSQQIEMIRIVDIAGKVVKSFRPETAVFDVSGLQAGIYFVQIQEGNIVFTQRIIKQ